MCLLLCKPLFTHPDLFTQLQAKKMKNDVIIRYFHWGAQWAIFNIENIHQNVIFMV